MFDGEVQIFGNKRVHSLVNNRSIEDGYILWMFPPSGSSLEIYTEASAENPQMLSLHPSFGSLGVVRTLPSNRMDSGYSNSTSRLPTTSVVRLMRRHTLRVMQTHTPSYIVDPVSMLRLLRDDDVAQDSDDLSAMMFYWWQRNGGRGARILSVSGQFKRVSQMLGWDPRPFGRVKA